VGSYPWWVSLVADLNGLVFLLMRKKVVNWDWSSRLDLEGIF
jgi:hypothetical protein